MQYVDHSMVQPGGLVISRKGGLGVARENKGEELHHHRDSPAYHNAKT